MVEAVRNGYKVQDVTRIFNVCRKTVWKWCKRTRKRGRPIYRDQSKRPHRNHRKVTRNAEIAIVVLREAFNWGTQRIAVNLQSPPPYIITLLESVTGTVWTPVTVSRQTVNGILKKHQLNGNPYKDKRDWKYFRATQPDEMWQIDLRGPIRIENIKGYVLVILDDYSRYMLYCKFYESIATETVLTVLQELIRTKNRKPQKLLVDNGPQFKETFTDSCEHNDIEVIHTPPHYPQCKGKVERVIRTFNEEFLRVCSVFDNPLQLMPDFQTWYNDSRYNMGILGYPAALYNQSFNVTDVA